MKAPRILVGACAAVLLVGAAVAWRCRPAPPVERVVETHEIGHVLAHETLDTRAASTTTTARKVTRRKVETRPDGTRIETTTEATSGTNTAASSASTATADVSATIERDARIVERADLRPRYRGQASWSLIGDGPALTPKRVDVAVRAVGPVWIGGYVNTRGPFEAGATLAVEFP